MQRYTFLVYHRQYDDFLQKLREIGVVHIAQKAEGVEENEELRSKMQLAARIQRTLDAAKTYLPQGHEAQRAVRRSGVELLDAFDKMVADKQQMEQQMEATRKEIQRMTPWGAFDSQTLQRLQQSGYVLQFFCCNAKAYQAAWEQQYNAFVVNTVGATTYFVTVNQQPIELDIESVQLNEHNAQQLMHDYEAQLALVVAQQAKLEAWSIENIENLADDLYAVNQSIDWQRVHLNTASLADDRLKLLEGYCPVENTAALDQWLDQAHIFYKAEAPAEGEAVPIQLKNNFFARLFEPITRLYSLPNYYEIDPTAFFAPFFMLFFGLCLGDGGYGLVVLLAGLGILWKAPKYKDWGLLAVFLGVTTMVVGILTGMFFGIELEKVAFLAPVKQYFITDANYKAALHGYSPMMVFAIGIGIFQILFAMGFKVAKITIQKGFKYAAYDCAWLVFLVDCILFLIAGDAPMAVKYVMYAIAGICVLLIMFYSNPDRKLLVLNLGSGLWGTYNMASGLLGDVLSYIRLFALGLAGGILGNVFNQLALQVGGALPAWIGWLPMVLIMVFGHGLNFALALISSVVHPLRLTFVEFYKNAGFEGGGQDYKPFKK